MGLLDRLKRDEAPATAEEFGIRRAEFNWVLRLNDSVYELIAEGELDDHTYAAIDTAWERIGSSRKLSEPDATAARTAAGLGYYARVAEAASYAALCRFKNDEAAAAFFTELGVTRSDVTDAELAAKLTVRAAEHPGSWAAVSLPEKDPGLRPRVRDLTLLHCVRLSPEQWLLTPDGVLRELGLGQLRHLWTFGYMLRAAQDLGASQGTAPNPFVRV